LEEPLKPTDYFVLATLARAHRQHERQRCALQVAVQMREMHVKLPRSTVMGATTRLMSAGLISRSIMDASGRARVPYTLTSDGEKFVLGRGRNLQALFSDALNSCQVQGAGIGSN